MDIIGLPHLQLSDKITIKSYSPMNIANKANQIISDTTFNELYSEDLY